ncbi:MAG: phosphatidate cytidylyltransferase [Rhodanobacter sp.]
MLLQRTLTALVLAPLVVLAILLPSTPVMAWIAAVVFLAASWEWTQLSGIRSQTSRIALLIVVAAMFALLGWANSATLTVVLLAAGVAWWLVACLWLRHFAFGAAPTRENVTLKLLAGTFVIFPTWIAMISIHSQQPHGEWWTLLALFIVWAADIGAYSSGRTFGGRKLAPSVSPGKTWSGVYGALVAGVLIATVGGWLLDVRGGKLVALALLALATVAISIVGDLLESLMKRHAKVKDSGTLVPGHGGLLDRLDSVFAALPIFAVGLLLLDL